MEFLILAAVGLGAFFLFKNRRKESPPTFLQPKYKPTSARTAVSSRPPARNRSAEVVDDDDDSEEEEDATTWHSWRHKVGTFSRPAGMVPLPNMSSIILKGTASRVKELKPFIDMMRTDKPVLTIRMEREATNAFDPNALRVWGKGSRGGEVSLGFVPADVAKKISETYRDSMPLMAELVSSGYTLAHDAAYVKIRILGPSAAERKAFLKK